MSRYIRMALGVAALGLAISGCPPKTPPATGVGLTPAATVTQPTSLDVYIPCAFAAAGAKIAELFEAEHPGIDVAPRVENVEILAQRIAEGRQPDVFMCVGDIEVKALDEAGLVDYQRDFAFGTIVLVTAADNPLKLSKLQDLAADRVKSVAVAEETTSVGYYARELLKGQSVWDRVEHKVVAVKMPIELLKLAGRGRVDAALAYAACFRSEEEGDKKKLAANLTIVDDLTDEVCVSIPCPAASIEGCPHPAEAKQFIDFLTSDEAQEQIGKTGFMRLDAPKCYEGIGE